MRFCRKQLLLANDSNWFSGLNPTICSTTFTLTGRGTYSRTQELLAFPQPTWAGRTGPRERGSSRPRLASTSELAERINLRSILPAAGADFLPPSRSERDWTYAERALARSGDAPEGGVRRIADFRSTEKSDPL